MVDFSVIYAFYTFPYLIKIYMNILKISYRNNEVIFIYYMQKKNKIFLYYLKFYRENSFT